MSRIIVKNLPNFLSDSKFREHFSKKGQVTDAKIIKTADGKSRCFGFIGFRTEQEANEAITYFNNTFIYTSRIAVEHAKPVNDLLLPRPWSAHSVGSSNYQKRHAQNSQNSPQLKSDEEDNITTKKKSKKSKSQEKSEKSEKSNLSDNGKVDNNQNDKLHEFLEVMQPRSKSKTWANDDLTVLDKKRSTVKVHEGDSDDDLYQDLPKKKKNDGGGHSQKALSEEEEEEEGDDDDDEESDDDDDEGSNDDESESDESLKNEKKEMNDTNDMDWFKSKMRRKFDLDESDEGDDDDEMNNINNLSHNRINKINSINSNNGITRNDDIEDSEKNENNESSGIKQNPDTHETNNNNNSDVPSAESIGETGRLFVRNLPYICTEEDLRKEFNKFGPLAEVHLPIDKETQKQKGFAYILYHIPEHAVKAYIELDSTNFMGRLLHIIPSREKPEKPQSQKNKQDSNNMSLKKKKEMKLKSLAGNDFNWNTMYMNSDTISESIAHRLNIKKSDILNPESDNMAARLALAETHIIQETKSYFELNGISLNSFGKKEKSDTVILVKNISFDATKEELEKIFGWYGEINKMIIPPSKTMAIIEFKYPNEARNAFNNLAYNKFKGLPLYLEKAPLNIFKEEKDQNSKEDNNNNKQVPLSSTDLIEQGQEEEKGGREDIDNDVNATLFVKNLNFNTSEEELRNVFKSTPGIKSAKIKMKNDPKNPGKKLSMGFGFVEYDNLKNAKNALKAMQGFVLDGHALQLKFSNRGLDVVQRKRKEDEAIKKKQESTKIIVKNIAFETTKKELRELFGAYGQIKSLRLPKKFDSTSRGFGFIEFLTKRDARNVMEKLSDTHLLGRHLILEYAESDDKNVEELREKIGREFISTEGGGDGTGVGKRARGDGRMGKRRKVNMEEWEETRNEMEDEMEE